MLGPWRRPQGLDDAPDGDAEHHDDLDAEEADPDGVEHSLLVSIEVAAHFLKEDRVHVLDEEEGLKHVASVPIWSCEPSGQYLSVFVFFNFFFSVGDWRSYQPRSEKKDGAMDRHLHGLFGKSRPGKRRGTLTLGQLDGDQDAVSDECPDEIQALGRRDVELGDKVQEGRHDGQGGSYTKGPGGRRCREQDRLGRRTVKGSRWSLLSQCAQMTGRNVQLPLCSCGCDGTVCRLSTWPEWKQAKVSGTDFTEMDRGSGGEIQKPAWPHSTPM